MKSIQPSAANSMGQPGPTLLTVAQAASVLQTTQKMVRHWLATGALEMAPTPSGRGRAITTRSVQALLTKTQAATHKPTRRATRPQLPAAGLGKETQQAADPPLLFTVLGSCQPLIEVLSDIHDFRMSRGRRYDLASILTLACVAMLCGCRTHANMALWGRYYGGNILSALGFNRARMPCSLTLDIIFNGLNGAELEARLARWANSIVENLPFHAADTNHKTARFEPGAKSAAMPDAVPGLQVLAPLGRYLGLPQRRAILSYGRNELAAINAIIGGLVLEGQVLAVKLPARVSHKFHLESGADA